MWRSTLIVAVRWAIWDQLCMLVLRSTKDLRESMNQGRGMCVLVPTMGALHQGHLSLIRQAVEIAKPQNGRVVVSIFVNPIQFDCKGDLEAYPRTEADDLKACENEGVDFVFIPDESDMYAADRSVIVAESILSSGLCGSARPGHFDGVCTVVLKLLLITGCHVVIFGEKDFQQLAIIRRMVRDLNVPVDVVSQPTLRESDGLAMSSRNASLTAEQRADAPRLFRALSDASCLLDPTAILDYVVKQIEASDLARIDYVELVDAETLQPASSLEQATILALAVFYGEVRLIDHVRLPAL